VRYWAELTSAERIEVVGVSDDARLIRESLEAGEIFPAGAGLYYARSYHKDAARSEERTIVATHNPRRGRRIPRRRRRLRAGPHPGRVDLRRTSGAHLNPAVTLAVAVRGRFA
jgi:uncharacterized protein with von Willebrand factor type A (vWA) domain